MLQFIRNLDGYGHVMSLNYNKKGSSHSLIIGGILTMAIYTFFFGYTVFLTLELFSYQDDSISNLKVP